MSLTIHTWTHQEFRLDLDKVLERIHGVMPRYDQSLSQMGLDSLDMLELVSATEQLLRTEFDITDFNAKMVDLKWPIFVDRFIEALKLNGYLVLTDG